MPRTARLTRPRLVMAATLGLLLLGVTWAVWHSCADDRADVRDAPTIEDVFAMEESDRSAPDTASFVIWYDSEWGFPASVDLRCPDGWTDCGTRYTVTNFHAGR